MMRRLTASNAEKFFSTTVRNARGYSDKGHKGRCRITCNDKGCGREFTIEKPCPHAKRQLGTVRVATLLRVVKLDHQPIVMGTGLQGTAGSISDFDAAGLQRAIAAEFGLEVADVTVSELVSELVTDSAKSVPKHARGTCVQS